MIGGGEKMAKVIYIAGYGRSGSTILDIILNGHREITGVGEVSLLAADWSEENRLCSCGKPYSDCEFWGQLFNGDAPLPELEKAIRKTERQSSIPMLLSNSLPLKTVGRYGKYHRLLFDYVSGRTGASIIVDSSKSARYTGGRFLALKKFTDADVRVIHLVRNGLSTLESLLVTGSNWHLEGYNSDVGMSAARAAAGWLNANAGAMMLGKKLGKGRYLRLRYEDFVENPEPAIRRIGRFAGFDSGELVEKIRAEEFFHVGHMVGGNRVRLNKYVKLKKPDRKKQRKNSLLRAGQRLVFLILCGRLQQYYGYPLRP